MTTQQPTKNLGCLGWAAAIIAIVFISFIPPQEKKYRVELTLEQWQRYSNGFEYVKERVRQSNLPSNEVAFMQDSLITKFQIELKSQIEPQIKSDTLKNKK